MAKAKYVESCVVNIEGVYNHEEQTIEVEDIGVKTIEEILAKFNGANIKMSVKISNELE